MSIPSSVDGLFKFVRESEKHDITLAANPDDGWRYYILAYQKDEVAQAKTGTDVPYPPEESQDEN
jgi:hypothetical protein